MTTPKGAGLTPDQMAELHRMTVAELRDLGDDTSPTALDGFKHRFDFADALEIEIARQMSDKDGVPLREALRLSAYTMAVNYYLAHKEAGGASEDFWLAVTASRNTWGSAPRGAWPVTGFGPGEYWSEMHYTGSLGTIVGEISESIGRDQAQYPDSDPARIFMCNVSAADRRLRKRAADLGIELHD